jgi:hypothetical protein
MKILEVLFIFFILKNQHLYYLSEDLKPNFILQRRDFIVFFLQCFQV